VLCDADLAVLAAPPDAYAAYASAVRAEYGHLPDEAFTAGRIAVLESLLALPALYRLPATAAWEPRARANLTAELGLLRARPS
jgi:predicted metal-dependent HD superfamily phosphohydrolase